MKLNILVVFFLIVSCHAKKPSDQTALSSEVLEISESKVAMPDSVTDYMNAALDTMQKGSIHRSSIDWPQLKKNTFEKATGATTYQQTYPAIQEALKALGDSHSFFITAEQHKQWLGKDTNGAAKPLMPDGMMLDKQFAYIEVPAFSSGDPAQMQHYASRLQAIIKELDAQNPLGWIIDLSYNSGGNMWPMLAGIGPLTGEGALGSFRASDGTQTPWLYEQGEVKADNNLIMKIEQPYKMKNGQIPVALLVSERTASSGEAILVSFMGRLNTRVIGSPTAGLSSANQNYTLRDGAQLILTTAVFSDRTGKTYGKEITPEVDLSNKWYFVTGFHQYIMREEAKDWIKNVNKK